MPGTLTHLDKIEGLSDRQIQVLRNQFGKNSFHAASRRQLIHIIWDIIKEPMFILLAIACSLYFILREPGEGIMMLLAIVIVITISLYQEVKSSNAIKALQQFTEPKVRVIRNSKEVIILSEDLLPGDIILLDEGMNVPADAVILQANDLSVNESIITGESLPADKKGNSEQDKLYQGSTINTGKCIAKVTEISNDTVLGKLGKSVGAYHPPKTLFQLQVNKFVRRLALFGLACFFIIFFLNYNHYHDWVASLLFALTLAMSAVPEEIPVAFSSFMALGAFKMSRLGIISRQPQVIENLGAVNVICLDKTGTITENKMQLKIIYDYETDTLIELDERSVLPVNSILSYAILASEINPFDAMEKAIWEAYHLYKDRKEYEVLPMIFEYPLQGQPPMMTHVYQHNDTKLAAAKGAAERVIAVCHLDEKNKNEITQHIKLLAAKGYRVIGVASAVAEAELPAAQDDFNWQFEGLLALYDPPKKNAYDVLKQFYDASIEVKLITGDYPETAVNIAGQVGIFNHIKCITGEQVMKLTEQELKQLVKTTNIFARMFPEAKLKVVEALKANGSIVAMTGDGVNDGPALKCADIGIAMGEKGTEIARQAADLILTDDNLEKIVAAVTEGRKIFSNLKKAIRYIITIHIPIILTASLPVIFGWIYPNIFTPIHIIFMELIMGPTCSIFFEKEPVEDKLMLRLPRRTDQSLFTKKELFISITQGIIIALGAMLLYYSFMMNGASLEETRTIVFTTLILSNVFLTFANRSFTRTIYYTSGYKNILAPVIIITSILFLAILHFVPSVRSLFQLTAITAEKFWLCFAVAFAVVMWFELYKLILPVLKKR